MTEEPWFPRRMYMKRSSHYHAFVFVCLFSFILTLSYDAVAVNRYWDAGGGTNTDWSITNNWSGDTEPVSTDNALIGDNSGVKDATATISQTGEVSTNLYLGNQAGTTGRALERRRPALLYLPIIPGRRA